MHIETMHKEATGHELCSTPRESITDLPPRSVTRPDHEAQAGWQQPGLSPSLSPRVRGDAPAFEMKFLLDESRARDVEGRLATRLTPDTHADTALGNAYRISTLYCDTPDFDVFHRIGSHRRRKYRVRRYGIEPRVYLERKTKKGERVRKLRTVIDSLDLPGLSSFSRDENWPDNNWPDNNNWTDNNWPNNNWPGRWFHEQLLHRRLEPVCRVEYLRTAYVGVDADGPLRLTFDRDIRSKLANDWTLETPGDGLPVLTDLVVCEFKFRGALPGAFKSVIRALALEPTGVSKYRYCLQAAGGIVHQTTNGCGRHGSLDHA